MSKYSDQFEKKLDEYISILRAKLTKTVVCTDIDIDITEYEKNKTSARIITKLLKTFSQNVQVYEESLKKLSAVESALSEAKKEENTKATKQDLSQLEQAIQAARKDISDKSLALCKGSVYALTAMTQTHIDGLKYCSDTTIKKLNTFLKYNPSYTVNILPKLEPTQFEHIDSSIIKNNFFKLILNLDEFQTQAIRDFHFKNMSFFKRLFLRFVSRRTKNSINTVILSYKKYLLNEYRSMKKRLKGSNIKFNYFTNVNILEYNTKALKEYTTKALKEHEKKVNQNALEPQITVNVTRSKSSRNVKQNTPVPEICEGNTLRHNRNI